MRLHTLGRLAGLATLLLALAGTTRTAAAQTGSNVDVLTGTITDTTGTPIAGAVVEAYSLETQVTRKTTTNARGRYTIFFNDGGGQYRVTVTMVGRTPWIANVSRQGDDDRIMLDVKLGQRAVQLQELVARGNRQPAGGANAPTPGSTERNFNAEQAFRLPVDVSDLAALAALVPGVVVTPGSDSTAASFSIAGQSGTANNYTVDGLSFGGSALPQDAVRATRVITNTFDVARGQFSGGLVSATTRGGSNAVQGSVSGNLRDYHLAFGGTDDVFTRGQTQQRLGFGYGGPLVRDKAFLFGSLQVDRSLAPIATLDAANASIAGRLGASPDSVLRFIDLVSQTGLTSRAGVIDPNRTSNTYTGLVRFDWNVADRHTLTVRGDLRLNASDPTRIGSTQLPQVGGDTEGRGGGVALSLASRLGESITNEFRAGFTADRSESSPFLTAPNGRVQNVSTLEDGSRAITAFGFGGNTGLPQRTENSGVELTNEVSLFSPSAAHRYRLGVLFNTQEFEQDVTTNRFGAYTYNSLADFEANQPALFTRTLQPTLRGGRSSNAALYLSDVWRPTGNLQFTLGARVERSWFGGAPARNAALEQRFGLRTDVLPSETFVTPRLGFSYSIAAAEQRGQAQRGFAPPALTIRGGIGVFRGTMPATLPGTAQAQSGLANTEALLSCAGAAAPIPDWDAFAANPGLIPTSCRDGAPGNPVLTGVPNVTTYASDYSAPRTVRSSLGVSRRFWNTWNLNVDASYTRGVAQSASLDRNLRTAAAFTLADGRPVYATPDLIDPTTGAIPLAASRQDAAWGRVNEVISTLENETWQFTASVNAFTRRGATLLLSYTWQQSRDQGGAGGGGGGFGGGRGGVGGGFGGNIATPGDPNDFLWATASGERRHNIQANITWPFRPGGGLELTAIGRMTSGTPYTPIVSGDINGDGSRGNDIALVVDPATATDPELAAGMERLLASLDGGARDCVLSQLGRIAERNSCRGPWQPSLDLQLNWRPAMFDQRLTMSLSTVNLLGGLDELFHGADGIKGWGGFARPDATLLQVNGFNPATNSFKYVVNERFGATGAGATAIRSPFQVAVQMRYTIGFDRQREFRRTLQGGNGQPNFVEQLLSRLDSVAPHPAKAALARKDSLVLDRTQVAKLTLLADSAALRLRPLVDSVRREMEQQGTNPDLQRLFPMLQPILAEVRRNQTTELQAVKAILTDAQWALLPDSVKTPNLQGNPLFGGGQRGPGFGPGAGGGPGGRPGRP